MQEFPSEHAPKKGKKSSPAKPILLSVGIFIGVVLSFLGGMQYQKSKAPATPAGNIMMDGSGQQSYGGGTGQQGGPRMRGMGGAVVAISGTSITISTPMGDITMAISENTAITNNGAAATIDDIKVGDTVMVSREAASSDVAKAIMINPSMMNSGQGGGQTVITN